MQNYIEKEHESPYFIFSFLRKTNQKPRKSIFNFYFYKTYQNPHKYNLRKRIKSKHLLCHNLLSESEQVNMDLHVFWFVLFANFNHSKHRDFTWFIICFSLQISIMQQL